MAAATTAPAGLGAKAKTWNGSASQADLMLTDQVITVTEADVPTGGATKAAAHRFVPGLAPTGRLHRAFSVFLFDDAGRLLLQRRAASKITFPGVWTNTCCSHQLHGQEPGEVDDLSDVAAGRAPGAAAAAVRKLEHELGIPRGAVPAASFKFLTRLHYCAPDPESGERGKEAVEEGGGAAEAGRSAEEGAQPSTTAPAPAPAPAPGVWGEHEVDYVLLARLPGPGADLPLTPNPEEVGEVAWVDAARLADMMDPASGLAWSPWFRIIARTWLLPVWWRDLDAAVGEPGAHVDAKVHRVEC